MNFDSFAHYFVVDAKQATVTTGLTVTTAHVILCGDDRFEITSVEDVKGRKMYLEILGKRMMADA